MIARERGLERLALFMIEGQGRVEEEAEKYLSAEVKAVSDALKGAMDIIAEEIADDAGIRAWVRNFIRRTGVIVCKAEDPEKESVYQMYYDYREPVSKMPPHLVHISELSSAYVKHPLEIVAVGQIVEVEVLSVDVAKGRIALTMKF